MNIPDAAIEAAARVMYPECWKLDPPGALDLRARPIACARARVAVEAAMPAIREAIAQEIEAEGKEVVKWLADTRSDATDMGRLIGTEDAYKDAIRIVRGDTP